MRPRHLAIPLLFFLLLGCSQQPATESTSPTGLAGSSWLWPKGHGEVLADVQVGGLQVRHTRLASQNCKSGFSEMLELNGAIGPDSTFVMSELLSNMSRCTSKSGEVYLLSVFMHSGGGLLEDGYALGRLFRKHGVAAFVAGDQVCASACSIAFLGAYRRVILQDGRLLFHAPYVIQNDLLARQRIDCSNKQVAENLEAYYVEMLGAESGSRLFSRTMGFCSDEAGWTVNSAAASLYGITN